MTYLPDPQLHRLLTGEQAERLRADGARGWSRKRPFRRRFGFVLVAAGKRLAACEAPPQPRHSTP